MTVRDSQAACEEADLLCRRAEELVVRARLVNSQCRLSQLAAIQLRWSVRRTRRLRIGPIFAMGDPTGPAQGVGYVLVVDNNDAVRQSTTEILQLAGYETLGVPGPDEALPVLAKGDVALVLLDVGVDFVGLKLLAHIQHPTQVILISGGFDRRRTPRVGPIFLAKPFDVQQLIAEVAKQLRRQG